MESHSLIRKGGAMKARLEAWRTKRRTAAERELTNDDGAFSMEVLIYAAFVVVALVAVFVGIRYAMVERGAEVTDCLTDPDKC